MKPQVSLAQASVFQKDGVTITEAEAHQLFDDTAATFTEGAYKRLAEATMHPKDAPPHAEKVHDAIWRVKLEGQLTAVDLPIGSVWKSVLPGTDKDGAGCINTYWIVRPSEQTTRRFLSLVGTGEALPDGYRYYDTIATGLHLVEIPAAFATA